MSDPSERLARLEARIAELEERRQPRRLRMPRGGRRLLAIGLALTLMIPTGVVMATHQFGDVPESNTFHGNITALAESGVTAGCGGGNYCPKGNVTREPMRRSRSHSFWRGRPWPRCRSGPAECREGRGSYSSPQLEGSRQRMACVRVTSAW
jgi:hypothetical protein